MRPVLVALAVSTSLALAHCSSGQQAGGGRRDGGAVKEDASDWVRLDSGGIGHDAGSIDGAAIDAAEIDAAEIDAAEIDAAAIDGAASDAASHDGGSPDAAPMDAAQIDSGSHDAGASGESGEVIVSAFLAAPSTGLEWIELYNTTTTTLAINGDTIAIDSHPALGAAPIHAASDPTGSHGTQVRLAPHHFAYGVPNPTMASTIPSDAAFVFGAPGAFGQDAIANGGDAITVGSAAGGIRDRLDFHRAITGQGGALGPSDFPIVQGVATELDPSAFTAALDNDGSSWCSPIFRGSTPGRANASCSAFAISEVLYDFASLQTQADAEQQFVELAGSAGGSFASVLLTAVDATTGQARDIAITAARMPMNGLYVVADDGGMGMTMVANANQLASLSLGLGPSGVQLIRHAPSSPPILLDAFGYGTGSMTVDRTRMLPIYEHTPVPDLDPDVHAIAWARADRETDSNNNLADFHFAATPTPGARNQAPSLTIMSIAPDNAIAALMATIVIHGADFTDRMAATVGGVAASSCQFVDVEALSCIIPSGGSAMPRRADVVVTQRPELNRSATLPMAFTFTASNNETNVPNECDYCDLQFPATLTVSAGAPSALIFGRIFEAGRTDSTTGGPAPGIIAQLGYGPHGSNPISSNEWIWQPATFNVETGSMGHDDEYQANLVIAQLGTYSYTYRFSLDGELTWSYADLDGAGSNGTLTFSAASLGTITVN